MTPEIRCLTESDLPDFIDALSTGFLDRPDIAKVVAEVQPLWELDRTWAAFDQGSVCGTFRSWPTELTVPGGARLPGAAVTTVTVMPSHRRRGVLRAMAGAAHGQFRELGEAFGLLYASEYPIYGRFGYGPACRVATWMLDTTETAFFGEPTRGVELARADERVRDATKAVYEAWRIRRTGEIRRREARWDFDLGLRDTAWGKRWNGFVALHRDGSGTVDGYVLYRAEEKWEQRMPRYPITVDDLQALNDEAYAALWRFLGEIDLVSTIRAEGRSLSERLPWLLTNARAATVTDVGDGLWVRIFDVPRALEARTYERVGSLVLEVIDGESDGGRVRVHLDAGPDGARCRQTEEPADLTLHVAALGAAYLGGTRLRDAVVVRGADEHRSGALAMADSLFRTLDEPRCSTQF